jgi:hypothetical protein
MACCVCGKNVAGLPVMRDIQTGLECCEPCGRKLGGPSGFIKHVDSFRRNRSSIPENRPPATLKARILPLIIIGAIIALLFLVAKLLYK